MQMSLRLIYIGNVGKTVDDRNTRQITLLTLATLGDVTQNRIGSILCCTTQVCLDK
jgi:hypothetical protein